MNIIIVGCGKVGKALAAKLYEEEHNITMIDTNAEKINRITNDLDVMGLVGNGSAITILNEAGLNDADVFIAVTGSDELNLLCCVLARKVGDCHTIARVRNPMYRHEFNFIKQQLDISEIINPEYATAMEIYKLLNFPAADKIDTFADGRVQLIKFELSLSEDGILIKDLKHKTKTNVLVCAVERGENVVIPNGDFLLQNKDMLTVMATPDEAKTFFTALKMPIKPARNAMIVGIGSIGYYLTYLLIKDNVSVRLIDRKAERCQELAEMFPGTVVLCGSGTDRDLLIQENITEADAFVSLTGIDEENVLMTLFAKKHSKAKTVTKINRLEFDDIIRGLDIGSVVYPKYITCDSIIQCVRSWQSKSEYNLKTLYKILDDRVEALELFITDDFEYSGVPLSKLKLKEDILVCCITRGDQIIIPKGNDEIRVGDTVIVVTFEKGLRSAKDILAH